MSRAIDDCANEWLPWRQNPLFEHVTPVKVSAQHTQAVRNNVNKQNHPIVFFCQKFCCAQMDPKRAFDYEQGQFIIHPFARLTDDISDSLRGLVTSLNEVAQQNAILNHWRSLQIEDNCTNDTGDDYTWHVTLLRGHRAIHRHQIKPLISSIVARCSTLESFNLCLDDIDIFSNFERTKQFIVITERKSIMQPACSALRSAVKDEIDKFAIRLTDEDDNEDTRAHCSLMTRDMDQCSSDIDEEERQATLKLVEDVCIRDFEQIPIFVTRVDRIHIKIGNHVYDIKLSL